MNKLKSVSVLMVCACLSNLAGCEVLEVVASTLADENAKCLDDPASCQACATAFNVCKANGIDSQACEAQRSALIGEDIYCGKVGVFSGSRGSMLP